MNFVKMFLTSFLVGLFTTVSVCQSDSVYIVQTVDEMTDEINVSCNRPFIVSNAAGNIGFEILPNINNNEIHGNILNGFIVFSKGIGRCNENDEMIILFETGDKITLKSWKKFNCDGVSYFKLNYSEYKLLKTTPIQKIRLTNGRTFDSYTGDVPKKNKRYFIQILNVLNNDK